jgi:hypothetical protein
MTLDLAARPLLLTMSPSTLPNVSISLGSPYTYTDMPGSAHPRTRPKTETDTTAS